MQETNQGILQVNQMASGTCTQVQFLNIYVILVPNITSRTIRVMFAQDVAESSRRLNHLGLVSEEIGDWEFAT